MQAVEHLLLFRRKIGDNPMQEQRRLIEQPLRRFDALHHHAARQSVQASVFFRGQFLSGEHHDRQVAERWSVAQTFQHIEARHIRKAQVEHDAVEAGSVTAVKASSPLATTETSMSS